MKKTQNKSRSSRVKKFIKSLTVVICMSVLFILLIEIFLRIFFPQNLSGKKIVGSSFSNEDELIGLRYSPGAKWQFSHPEYKVIYEINENGFRDKKKHPLPKPNDIIRILLLGDSFTFGQGVSYEQAWPVLVENWMDKNGISNIDIVKAGMQGLDTRTEYILMKQLLDSYDCDIVVIAFLINDLYTNSFEGIDDIKYTSSADSTNGRDISKKNSLANDFSRIFIRNRRKNSFHLLTLTQRLAISNEYLYCKLYFLSARKDYLSIPLKEIPQNKLQITESLFEKIASYCKSLDKQLIVFSLPQQFQYLYVKNSLNYPNIDVDFYDKYFGDIAEKNDFTWIETLDNFRNIDSNKKLFFRFDGHLSPEGCKLTANIFIEKVLPQLTVSLKKNFRSKIVSKD